MSKVHTKIVDLQKCEDGTYVSKHDKKLTTKDLKKSVKRLDRAPADDFLNGIDTGLDFVENIVPRIDRFLRLRD